MQTLRNLYNYKKRDRRPTVAIASAITLPSNALHITDSSTNIKYLVDTGACCSLFPADEAQKLQTDPDPIQLFSAGGQRIRTHGKTPRVIHIAGVPYKWDFRLADVTQPLLGADFLIDHRLVVDMAGHAVVPSEELNSPNPARSAPTMGSAAAVITSSSSGGSANHNPQGYWSLKEQYSDIFKP